METFSQYNAVVHAVHGMLRQQAEDCKAYVDLMEDTLLHECALV